MSTREPQENSFCVRGTSQTKKGGGNCGCTWPGRRPSPSAAFVNLKRLCEEHLAGQYRIEVIDLMEKPQLAKGDQILAIPTLVRKLPEPLKKIIGDLSNTERVLVGLDVREVVSVRDR